MWLGFWVRSKGALALCVGLPANGDLDPGCAELDALATLYELMRHRREGAYCFRRQNASRFHNGRLKISIRYYMSYDFHSILALFDDLCARRNGETWPPFDQRYRDTTDSISVCE